MPRLSQTGLMAVEAIMSSFPSSGNSNMAEWPEPIQRVQLLAESGVKAVPPQYIRPELERPNDIIPSTAASSLMEGVDLNVPIIDLSGLQHSKKKKEITVAEVERACKSWGFFQVINHGVPQDLIDRAKLVAKQFFDLPLELKQAYANNPSTYEGYGSRLGLDKGAILDWGDYYYLNVFPTIARDMSKWPTQPILWRETMEEYSKHMLKLSQVLLEAISTTLRLSPSVLKDAFGGDEGCSLSQRINFYPPCPQPNLTLGLSPHSDPGGLTILLQDDKVYGLQVHYEGRWVYVKPIPGAFVINLADQIQILTNGRYKSVEHRVVVNRDHCRLSIAAFCNPSNNHVIKPLKELVSEDEETRYNPMTFKEYRSFIRRKGTMGKCFLDCVKSPRYSSNSLLS